MADLAQNIKSGQIAAGASAAPLASQQVRTVGGVWLVATAAGAYFGDSTVTTGTGCPIPAGFPIHVPIWYLSNLYIIGTGTVGFFYFQ